MTAGMICCCVPESHCFSSVGLLVPCYMSESCSHQYVPQQYEALHEYLGFVYPREQ